MLEWWNRKSILAKIVIVIVAACALLIATVSIRSCVIHSRDERFDKQEQQHAQEREEWQREREQAIGRAQAAEAAAKDAEARVLIQEAVLSSLGKQAEALAEKAMTEDARLVTEWQTIGQPVEPRERCRRICERLKLKDCGCE